MASVRLRRVAKSAAAALATYSGVRRAMTAVRRFRSGGRRIVSVGYHRVVEDFTGEVQRSIPGTLISAETLRKQLEQAHRDGFEFATIDQVLDVLAGRTTAKRDLFLVTFDDGYRDTFRYGLPVLERLGVPAVMYLPAEMIGTQRRFNHDRLFHLVKVFREEKQKPFYASLPPAAAVLLEPIFSGKKSASAALDDFIGEFPTRVLTEVIDALEAQLGAGARVMPEGGEIMTWDEVRRMQSAGVTMGAHTLGHCVLTMEDPVSLRREIRESKAIIERETGRPCEHFAYCNGWYSDEVIRELVAAGFKSGITTEDVPNVIGGDPFTIKRKVVWENFSTGHDGTFSPLVIGCHFDDVFGMLGATRPVLGRKEQLAAREVR